MRIRISWPKGQVIARLKPCPTTERMVHTLPYTTRAHRTEHGVMVKFPVNVEPEAEEVDELVPGTLCYWGEGQSLALAFEWASSTSPSTLSGGPISILGQLEDDPSELLTIEEDDPIRVQVLGDGGT